MIIHGTKTAQQVRFESASELDTAVRKNAESIFGKDSVYFDLKGPILERNKKTVGAGPDGYVLFSGTRPTLALVQTRLYDTNYTVHTAARCAHFEAILGNLDKWHVINGLREYLEKRPAESKRASNLAGGKLDTMIQESVMDSRITHVVVTDRKIPDIDVSLCGYPVRAYVIHKHAGANTYSVDGPDADPGAEAKYLEENPDIAGLYGGIKSRIADMFPGAIFCFDGQARLTTPGGRPFCGLAVCRKQIRLEYAVNEGDGVLHESSTVQRMPGEIWGYSSIIRDMDDFDRALPFMEKVWRLKTCRRADSGKK